MKACILIIEDCDINDLKELINTLENKTLKDGEVEYEEIKTINQEKPNNEKTKTSNNKKRKYVIEGLDF